MEQTFRQTSAVTTSRESIAEIREKGPVGKAQETLEYLAEIEAFHADIRRRLYGPFPESGEVQPKSSTQPSLEEMLQWICQRTAQLAGDSKNLLSRLD